jgi:hypothetical protein
MTHPTGLIDEQPRKTRMKHQVTTFASGWSYHAEKGWGQHESGGRSSHQDGIPSKRRAIEAAKKLADLCGDAVAVIVTYKKGVRLFQDITFTRKP